MHFLDHETPRVKLFLTPFFHPRAQPVERASGVLRWGNTNRGITVMKPTIAMYAAPILLSLAINGGAEAASAKSGCVFFCGDSAKPAEAAAAASSPATEAASTYDLETAISQAQTARKAGDYLGAAKILSQLVLVAPDDSRVLGEYGKTLAAEGRSDDALAFLDRAIQLQPDDWSYYSAQGIAYDQKGAYQAAQASYSRALSLKPGEPTVLNNAALSHMQSGDLDGAKTLLEQASPATTQFPRIGDNLALVQHLIESRPQAVPQPVPVVPQPVPAAPPPPAPVKAAQAAAPAPVAEVPVAPPAPVVASAPAPQPAPATVVASPVETMALAAPKAEVKPTEAASPATPPSTYAALQADPTVRMAPIPKEEAARPAPPRVLPRAVLKPSLAPETRVADASVPAPAPKANPQHNASTYYVQAGAYASEERAGRLAQSLDSLGARVSPATVDGRAVYRVRIGPFLDKDQANAAISQAQSMGQADLRIVSE